MSTVAPSSTPTSTAAGGTTPTTSAGGTTPTTPTTTIPTTAPTTTPTTAPAPPPTQSVVTTSITASSTPTSTQIFTSIITQTPTQQTSLPPTTVVVVTSPAPTNGNQQTTVPGASTTSGSLSPTKQAAHKSGLSTGGKTAIAVVIPIVVVAVLIFLGILLWRRQSRHRDAAEERRKEMEAYQYNPNDDPTLPAIGKDAGLVDDNAGYRGWGPAGSAGVGRKPSTNASSGVPQYSDPGTLVQPTSPTHAQYATDAQGNTISHHRNGTMDSDTMGNMAPMAGGAAAGAAGAAGAASGAGLRRGVSNASSTYSNGNHSNHSHSDYPIPYNPNNQEYYTDNTYYQQGPYENYNNGAQPVMRESPARRLQQVLDQSVNNPQHGGIARNF